ncbi:MAG: hypothetical protein ACKVPX_07410 [Myxococcaceae bacterium]
MSWASNIGGYAKTAAQWITDTAAYGPIQLPFGNPVVQLTALTCTLYGAVKGASGRGRYHGFVRGFLREAGKGLVGGCVLGAIVTGLLHYFPPRPPPQQAAGGTANP